MVAIGRYSKISGKFIPKEPEVEHTYYIDENGMICIASEKVIEDDRITYND